MAKVIIKYSLTFYSPTGFLLLFFFFFKPYLSFNASYDQQVSEPSCILDLRRVPPGVGRVGLQASIFPVSINYEYNFFQLD